MKRSPTPPSLPELCHKWKQWKTPRALSGRRTCVRVVRWMDRCPQPADEALWSVGGLRGTFCSPPGGPGDQSTLPPMVRGPAGGLMWGGGSREVPDTRLTSAALPALPLRSPLRPTAAVVVVAVLKQSLRSKGQDAQCCH